MHGHGSRQVLGNFFTDALLRCGQLKGQGSFELVVRTTAFGFQGGRSKAVPLLFGHVLGELLCQQFFGFEPLPGRMTSVF